MKKILVLTSILVSVLFFTNCNSTEESDQQINDRIAALQTAINSHSYSGYLSCFDNSASMWDSYLPINFDNDYSGGIQYTFSSDILIIGNTATVTSTKSTTGTITYDNTFTMVQADKEWFIKTWTEDTTPIFFKKK